MGNGQWAWRRGPLACVGVVVLAVAGIGGAAGLGGCSQRDDEQTVVLYSSVDGYLLREIVAKINERTGLRVEVVGDTELTKTTGLVERVLSERGRPRADVWWSSEAFGTIRLAREGVLTPIGVEPDAGAIWPAQLRGQDDLWIGFAQRARVIAYASDRVDASDAPTSLAELTGERWRGRVGIARPQFGTTRGHMAALVELWGEDVFEDWLAAMKANGVRVLDGNATVVREIARGTIDVGLTDTDDVFAAQREGLHVGLVYERLDEPRDGEAWSPGAMVMPNTVALVANGPNPHNAAKLIEAILSEQTERAMMESDSRNFPVRETLLQGSAVPTPEGVMEIQLEQVADRVARAIEICERVLR